MVEHAWVRIAEIREEAALEEWRAANPRLAWLLKTLRWLRIRWMNYVKEFHESERGERFAQYVRDGRAVLLSVYLACTRTFGCRPRRRRVAHLSTRQLIDEVERRHIDRSELLERSDLLDALCGPPAEGDDAASDERDELVPPSPVDKMV